MRRKAAGFGGLFVLRREGLRPKIGTLPALNQPTLN